MHRYNVHVLWTTSRFQPGITSSEAPRLLEDLTVEASNPQEAAQAAEYQEAEELAQTVQVLCEDVSVSLAVNSVELVNNAAEANLRAFDDRVS